MKALQCPFLTRIPICEVQQQAGELLKLADLCPVMGHVMNYASAADGVTGTALNDLTNKCPFMQNTMSSEFAYREAMNLAVTAHAVLQGNILHVYDKIKHNQIIRSR